MSIVPINIGGAANDGNGQSLRSGGQAINANFVELDTRTAAAQEAAEQGIADAAAAQAKADEAIPGSAVGVTVAQLVEGLVPSSQLPSYVDDVLEFPALADFPAEGETGKIYIAINDGDSPSNPTRQYRWSGTAYVMIPSSPGSTDQVPEGSINLYHTAARVRATTLTGLSASLNEAVAATDSVLSGIGKLQAQVSAAVSTLSGKFDKTGGKLTGALNNADIVSLASSAKPAIGAAAANTITITITGTTSITGFDSIASGAVRTLVFSGAVTLTHNAASLILPKSADITTAAGDVLQFTSLGGGNWRCTGKMLAADGGAATGGMWVGMKIAWPLSEASIPGGGLPDNGQLVDRATWPDLWALYSSQAVSDATWIADPLQRGKASTGNGTSTFRMPDTNGKYSDGLTPAAAVLRGYGKNSAGVPGLFQLDQFQGFQLGAPASPQPTRRLQSDSRGYGSIGADPSIVTSPFMQNVGGGFVTPIIPVTDGVNGTPRVGTETRGTGVTVIWVTVAANTATNIGSVDVMALAGTVTAQASRITDLEYAYTSGDQSWTNGGTVTLSHGFGSAPSRVSVDLICVITEGNYAVGSVLPMGPTQFAVSGVTGYGFQTYVTATNINIRVISNGIQLWNATTNAGGVITPANWRFRVKASKS